MHFLECLDLAQHINRTRPSWTILAIGRFVSHDDIRLGMPWGISVRESDADRPRVIWSRDDLDGRPGSRGEQTQAASAAEEPSLSGMLF